MCQSPSHPSPCPKEWDTARMPVLRENRFLSWRPSESSSHAPVLRSGRGPQQGHKVMKNVSKPRHSRRLGHLTKHAKFVGRVIREVCCFAPHEWRALELLKVSKDKQALKFIKRRVGVHIRAKRKQE